MYAANPEIRIWLRESDRDGDRLETTWAVMVAGDVGHATLIIKDEWSVLAGAIRPALWHATMWGRAREHWDAIVRMAMASHAAMAQAHRHEGSAT